MGYNHQHKIVLYTTDLKEKLKLQLRNIIKQIKINNPVRNKTQHKKVTET